MVQSKIQVIKGNIEKLRERMSRSCERAGRKKEEIKLVAVTKTVPAERILEAVQCGIEDIGESRVQESQDKFQAIHRSSPSLQWHMVGHLQRNKVNRAVEIFDIIQSVDSIKLAEAINRRASEIGKIQECLVEIKVSEEQAKLGLPPEELDAFLESCGTFKNIRLKGIMAVAPFNEDVEKARPYFRKAQILFDRFFAQSGTGKNWLSMGMSHDFEAAIEEGSTLVRVGAAIFGERTAAGNLKN